MRHRAPRGFQSSGCQMEACEFHCRSSQAFAVDADEKNSEKRGKRVRNFSFGLKPCIMSRTSTHFAKQSSVDSLNGLSAWQITKTSAQNISFRMASRFTWIFIAELSFRPAIKYSLLFAPPGQMMDDSNSFCNFYYSTHLLMDVKNFPRSELFIVEC